MVLEAANNKAPARLRVAVRNNSREEGLILVYGLRAQSITKEAGAAGV